MRSQVECACVQIILTVTDVEEAVKALGDSADGRGANGEIARQLESGGREGQKVLDGAV